MRSKLRDYFSFIKSEFFNLGPMVSFVWRNDNGWSVETVSSNIKENFFYDPEDFLSGSLIYAKLIHRDDIKRVTQEVLDACTNHKQSFIHEPYRLKNGFGEYRWVKDTTSILYDEKGNISHFVGYILDVTETRNNLLQVKEHEQKLQAAQALAKIGNWELDLRTDELYWSDQIYNIFEIDPNNFKASYESFLELIHPEDKKLFNDLYMHSLQTGEKYIVQHRLMMKDGRVKYVEVKGGSTFNENGKPIKSIGTVQDITHLKQIEIELEKTLSFFKSHQIAMDESAMVTKSDLKGVITYINENFSKISGYSREEAIGQAHSILRHPDNPIEMFQELWTTIKSKKIWKKVFKNRDKYGKTYWVDATILPILDEKGEISEYIAVRYDVTKMIEQQKQLDEIANTDILTGLGNRYKLLNEIQTSIKPALAILNIDSFSQINDLYGHELGDSVIKEFGCKLSECKCHENFQVYHLQGDEYVVFHPNIDHQLFYTTVLELKNNLSQVKITLNDEEISFNFSMSISYESKENLLSTADMALKIAKRENQDIVIYRDEISLNSEYENNIKWTKKIKEAIETENIIPVFQPIVNNVTHKWEKYESLVRLRDKDRLVTPLFFLDIAKKTKHYTQITKIMIATSFEVFANKDAEFSINLTVEDITNHDIKHFIFNMLESYKNGNKVVFEIVESESIQNFEEVLYFIATVKRFGCKIAIDDFGTGYSNFEYLMRLKADYIKIDGSLVKDICTNKSAELVVETIVDFAKKLDIKTIAEFVENEEILQKVTAMGVDYSQGYHFSEPKEKI